MLPALKWLVIGSNVCGRLEHTSEILRDFSQILKNIYSFFVNMYVGGREKDTEGADRFFQGSSAE